ncbi:MAG: hypothetical protein ACRC1J_08400 [Sandaracinobacteroides sp.]
MRTGFLAAAPGLAAVSAVESLAGAAQASANAAPAVDPIGIVMLLLGLAGALAVRLAHVERRIESPAQGKSRVVRAQRFSQP